MYHLVQSLLVPPRDRQRELLDAVIPVVAEHAFADLTLRQLAEAVGTSHRMLIHHFGSRDGLWAAIVAEMERRQLELFVLFEADPGASVGDTIGAWWQHLSDPWLWPNERLFFEIYAQA